MTADERFKELGYGSKIEIVENNALIIIKYIKENKYEIKFKMCTKEILISGFQGIEIEELEAINTKCKELGWI